MITRDHRYKGFGDREKMGRPCTISRIDVALCNDEKTQRGLDKNRTCFTYPPSSQAVFSLGRSPPLHLHRLSDIASPATGSVQELNNNDKPHAHIHERIIATRFGTYVKPSQSSIFRNFSNCLAPLSSPLLPSPPLFIPSHPMPTTNQPPLPSLYDSKPSTNT